MKIIDYFPHLWFSSRHNTFHASKGLEADNVAIVGLIEWKSWDSNPSKNMDSHLNTYVQNVFEKRNHYEEERRLFYVALTRAKKKLFLVSQFDSPSNLLIELKESSQAEAIELLGKYSKLLENQFP